MSSVSSVGTISKGTPNKYLQVKLYVHYTNQNYTFINEPYIIRSLHESKLHVHYTIIRMPTAPINCNLHFYHSIYLMIKKFDWRKIVPIYQDSPYNADLQRVKDWQIAVWQGRCSRVYAMFMLGICHVYVRCILWYRYLVFVTSLQSVCNGAIKPLWPIQASLYIPVAISSTATLALRSDRQAGR